MSRTSFKQQLMKEQLMEEERRQQQQRSSHSHNQHHNSQQIHQHKNSHQTRRSVHNANSRIIDAPFLISCDQEPPRRDLNSGCTIPTLVDNSGTKESREGGQQQANFDTITPDTSANRLQSIQITSQQHHHHQHHHQLHRQEEQLRGTSLSNSSLTNSSINSTPSKSPQSRPSIDTSPTQQQLQQHNYPLNQQHQHQQQPLHLQPNHAQHTPSARVMCATALYHTDWQSEKFTLDHQISSPSLTQSGVNSNIHNLAHSLPGNSTVNMILASQQPSNHHYQTNSIMANNSNHVTQRKIESNSLCNSIAWTLACHQATMIGNVISQAGGVIAI